MNQQTTNNIIHNKPKMHDKLYFQKQNKLLSKRIHDHEVQWIYNSKIGIWCLKVDSIEKAQGSVWQEGEGKQLEWYGFCGPHRQLSLTRKTIFEIGPHVIGPRECVVAGVEEYVLHIIAISFEQNNTTTKSGKTRHLADRNRACRQ